MTPKLCPIYARISNIYTTTYDLDESGWERSVENDRHAKEKLASLEPAFTSLGLTYDLADTIQITWNHERDSQNAEGQTAPVCFYRLY